MRYGREVAEYEELVRAAKLSSQKRSYRWWKRQPKLSENDFLEATSRGSVAEQRVYCEQLKDIFGNPFRPVSFSPSWRSSTAVSLAAQVYESRDFGAMPILADALQDAGCENEDILSHCRGAGPHVRGCWVVDLVLGKD
ncbi:Uncharacterized protein (Fragment) OS=uncultured bacterium PE=4 SV=1 [Gemmata massiliana]|uniref:SMI1/KNR4 family protein n=2 Tax=Gemmata massiliana TaxID=1210884 RepID=A0A6P2D376_9BACT